MLELLLAVAGGLLVGAIAALKIIAPRTATKTDDKALEYLEKAKEVGDKLGVTPKAEPPFTPEPASPESK